MKTATVASAVFVAAAAAQPHGHGHNHKHVARAVVTETEWVTEIQYVTELVDSTTTLWITPGQEPAPTTSSDVKPNFFEPPSSAPALPPVTVAAAPSVPSAAPPPPPPPSTTSSVYVPPPPPPPPAAPTTSSVYVAPSPSPQPSQQPAPSSGGGSSGGKGSITGDITYYDVGLGACGIDDSGLGLTDNIVAISHLAQGASGDWSADWCKKTITIKANGKSITALVHDKCMGCAADAIDVSRAAFLELFGSFDSGRDTVSWELN